MAGLECALPASYYLDQAAFDRERERLLFGEWFCAGRADQVERPGSLVVRLRGVLTLAAAVAERRGDSAAVLVPIQDRDRAEACSHLARCWSDAVA